MQCSRSNSFSRQSGKTQRESRQTRQLCQSRKSRQARLNAEPEPKKLQTNPVEHEETSSSEEEQHFGPDKISRKHQGKKKRFEKPSKQANFMEDYVSPFEMNRLQAIEDAKWTAWCAKVHPEILENSESDDNVVPSALNKSDEPPLRVCDGLFDDDENSVGETRYFESNTANQWNLKDTRYQIPHHLLWDFHLGDFPDYLQALTQCVCWDCDYGRKKYKC